MRPAALSLCISISLACSTGDALTTVASTASPTTASPGSTSEGTSEGSGATGTGGATGASSTGEVSTTEESGVSSGGTLVLDVGVEKDVSDPTPAGCQGKIDVLFVISSTWAMQPSQDKLVAAFPKFIATIEGKFADFDVHLMVIEGDGEWGLDYCDADCPVLDCTVGQACCPFSPCIGCNPPVHKGATCCPIPAYPCGLLDEVNACDNTMGAGMRFPAGRDSSNQPCPIAGGRRYLTQDQPDLAGTFACIARVGTSGSSKLGEAMTEALQAPINKPGGCNAGFLRKDALLLVTFIGGFDYLSKGEPSDWAAAVLAAKGDPGAVVMLEITNPECPEYDRICHLVKMFPYHLIKHLTHDDYGAAFAEAADLVEEACADFIPG